jgi:hypothetical protein
MNIYNLKHFHKRLICNTLSRHFSSKLTSSEKKNIILKTEKAMKEEYNEEYKQFENKMQPVFNYMNYIRSPIYATIIGLIWSNPFSLTFTYFKLFSNYYLIFLTGLEGAAIFSLGLIDYYLVKYNVPDDKELVDLKTKNNFKRLIMIISFFLLLFISGANAQSDRTILSLMFLIYSNIYLYVKYGLQMGNHMGNSLYFMPRMKFVYTNILLAACLIIIASRKDKIIQLNIKY